MTTATLPLALLAAAALAESMFPRVLEPRALRAQTQDAAAVLPELQAKVRVAVSAVAKASEAAKQPLLALGATELKSETPAKALFLFKAAPPPELRVKLKQAVAALAKLGVVSGYKEELLPPIDARARDLSAELATLRFERQELAKALERAPRAAKAIDDEIARLGTVPAEDETRLAVLTVFFDQENSGVDPAPETLERVKEKLREGPK